MNHTNSDGRLDHRLDDALMGTFLPVIRLP